MPANDTHAVRRILFVCLGNICRSVAAQTILEYMAAERGLSLKVDSAGTYGGHAGQEADRRMRMHARQRGYNLTHRARRVRENDFDCFDMIVAMDDSNHADLLALAPTPQDETKVVRMSDFFALGCRYDYVPDPYYEGAEGFELVLDLLEVSCRRLLDRIS